MREAIIEIGEEIEAIYYNEKFMGYYTSTDDKGKTYDPYDPKKNKRLPKLKRLGNTILRLYPHLERDAEQDEDLEYALQFI